MTIETKFNILQDVYLINNMKAVKGQVANITWEAKSNKCRYFLSAYGNWSPFTIGYDDSQIFSTKEELLKSL